MLLAAEWTFGIRDTDRLFPVCSDGLGVSQVVFHVLSGVKRWLGVAEGIVCVYARF